MLGNAHHFIQFYFDWTSITTVIRFHKSSVLYPDSWLSVLWTWEMASQDFYWSFKIITSLLIANCCMVNKNPETEIVAQSEGQKSKIDSY